MRGIVTQLPSRPTRVALPSHTPSTRHGCTPSRSTTRLPGTGQMPLHTGGSHDLERGTHRRAGNQAGGILGVGLVWQHQRDQHGHQPLPR